MNNIMQKKRGSRNPAHGLKNGKKGSTFKDTMITMKTP